MPATEPRLAHREQAEHLADAVREAGAVALRTFRGTLKSWTKGNESPVSEADIAVNELLHERLARDGTGWLSEESENDPDRLSAARVWVVDPIDGTRAYIAGRVDWTIAVALVEEGRPVVAAIFAPVTDELFVAIAGGGAARNGVPMAVNGGESLEGARLAGPQRYLDQLRAATPTIVAVPRIHSLALRLTRVAEGVLDAAVASGNSHDWDLAAADLLVHEAGGAMTTLAGQALTYNRAEPVHGVLVAAGRERHERLLELMNERRIAFA